MARKRLAKLDALVAAATNDEDECRGEQMSLPPLPSATARSAFFPSATESALGQSWGMAATAVVVQRQPGGEVRLDDAVEYRALGLAPVVNGQRAPRFGSRGRYGGIRIGAV